MAHNVKVNIVNIFKYYVEARLGHVCFRFEKKKKVNL